MHFALSINSIVVPRDSDRVLIGLDMGMAGARGEIAATWQEAKQLAADLDGAAEKARQNSQGGQHTMLICDTGQFQPRHFGLDAGTGNYQGQGTGLRG